MICKKCNSETTENFCSNCGFPTKVNRLNSKFIFHEIGEVVNLNKGLFYTIKELSIRPGKAIKHYIEHDRTKLVRPIVFLFMCSLLYTIFSKYTTSKAINIEIEEGTYGIFNSVISVIENNYGYANLFLALVASFWTRLLFRKHGYNFFEVFVLLCYVTAYTLLFYVLFVLLDNIFGIETTSLSGVFGVIYTTWAIGQFFESKKIRSYIKALTAYTLMTLTVLTLGVGIAIIYIVAKGA